jgi:DNA polymerase-3 subunit delta'
MDRVIPQFLPWQTDILEHAMALKHSLHLPHAVLIDTAGEQDISGFGLYLSMLLLCDNPDKLALCNRCQACQMMAAGTYADFSQVSLERDEKTKKLRKNISIEQIRKLIHEVSLTRQHKRMKIATIYPAESMNVASANALLKTLEEPTPETLIILLTHNRGRIPVTLRSRCQSWSINRPSRDESLQWLEKQDIDPETAIIYLQFADGDPELALALKQQNYGQLVEQFKSRFSQYLRGDLGITDLCRGLLSSDNAVIRRLVNMTLSAYCYRSSGLDSNINPVSGADRPRAQALLDLRLKAQHQLRIEENNLDLQLQLEDVLISLKQILTRRSI